MEHNDIIDNEEPYGFLSYLTFCDDGINSEDKVTEADAKVVSEQSTNNTRTQKLTEKTEKKEN